MPDFPGFALGFAAAVGLVLGFADGIESVVVSGARKASGLGVADAVAVAGVALELVLEGVDDVVGVDDFDWPRARGERRKIRAAASTRGFIVLESLLGLSQNPEQRFTLIRTLQGVRVLTRPR